MEDKLLVGQLVLDRNLTQRIICFAVTYNRLYSLIYEYPTYLIQSMEVSSDLIRNWCSSHYTNWKNLAKLYQQKRYKCDRNLFQFIVIHFDSWYTLLWLLCVPLLEIYVVSILQQLFLIFHCNCPDSRVLFFVIIISYEVKQTCYVRSFSMFYVTWREIIYVYIL